MKTMQMGSGLAQGAAETQALTVTTHQAAVSAAVDVSVSAGVHNLTLTTYKASVDAPIVVIVPSGAGGRPSRQRRKRIIVDDTLYNVTEAEEAQILRDYIESLKEEKQEVQKEVSKARKLVKKAKAQTENKPKPLYQPTKSTISSLLNELKRIEEKRKDAIRRYNAIMAEMEDEEDAISIILTMGGL